MKKISLFMAVIISVLAFSFVFAAEESVLIAPAPDAEENTLEESAITSSEEVSESIENPEESTELTENVEDEPATDNTEVQEAPTVVNNDTTTKTNSNSTITGAIIAIVIVLVVVALAFLFQKK